MAPDQDDDNAATCTSDMELARRIRTRLDERRRAGERERQHVQTDNAAMRYVKALMRLLPGSRLSK